jgi:signal transduction histidine kinase
MQPKPEFVANPLKSSLEETLAALPETIVHVDGRQTIARVNRPESPIFIRKAWPGDLLSEVLDEEANRLVFDMIANADITGGALAEYRWGSDLYRITAKPLTTSPLTLLIFRNITGIRSAGQTIVDLVRDRSSFLAAVSHELRSPLSSVVGYANLLSDPASTLDDDARTELVRDMTDQAWDLAGIVEDLLTVANVELGELNMAKVQVDVGANVAQVIESMGVRADEIEVREDEPVRGVGDPARYRQIVRNLLSNALRHGDGPISVTVSLEDDMAVLTVRDHGEGISDELADLVGHQATGSHSPTPGTVGLGLWISQELTRLMGGTLTYRREEGETVFRVAVPAL